MKQMDVALDPMAGTLQTGRIVFAPDFRSMPSVPAPTPCHCIGPQPGEKLCPCALRAASDSFARAPVVATPPDRGILALDPGTDQTGWCVLLGGRVLGSGVTPNALMLEKVMARGASTLAIEMIASYQGLFPPRTPATAGHPAGRAQRLADWTEELREVLADDGRPRERFMGTIDATR